MRKFLTTVFLIYVIVSGFPLNAQDYKLTWSHDGPVSSFVVKAEGRAPVVVNPPNKSWVIPNSTLATVKSFIVEACNTVGICASSQAAVVPAKPSAPYALQIGLLGTMVPIDDIPPTPLPPSNLGGFFPVDDSVDVATNVTFVATADNYTSCQLFVDTENPPEVGPVATGTCSFNQTLEDSETYYYIFEVCNAVGCINSGVKNFNTITPESPELLTDGDNILSAGLLTRGLVLPEGAATGGVVVVDSDGDPLVTQTDVKTTWDDGSIRFAVVTTDIPASGIYNVKDSTQAVGTFVPVVPTVRVDFDVYPIEGGTTEHAAVAPSTLSSACWLNGPLVKECRDVVTLDNSPVGFTQYLNVYVNRRVYHNGQSRVDVVVNNMKRISTAGPVPYSATITVNGSLVYTFGGPPTNGPNTFTSNGANFVSTAHLLQSGDYVQNTTAGANIQKYGRVLTVSSTGNSATMWGNPGSTTNGTWRKVPKIHAWGSRWRQVFNVNGLVEATIEPDFSTLYAAKAMPTYLPLPSTATDMEGVGAECWLNPSGQSTAQYQIAPDTGSSGPYDYCWQPLGLADWQPDASGPGGRDEIGMIPGVQARYLVNKTQALRANLWASGNLSGSWSRLHMVHSTSESMVDLIDAPTISGVTNSGSTSAGGGAMLSGYFPDDSGAAHQSNFAYIPYLVYGDEYFKEEMKFWGDWGPKCYPSGRNGSQGLVTGQQVRAGAWALRDLVNAANYLPDDDEHKSYFHTLVQNNMTQYGIVATQQEALDPVLKGWRIETANTDGVVGKHSPGLFMNAFLALALQHVIRQGGFTGGVTARDMLADYQINMYIGADDFDPMQAGTYHHWALNPDLSPFDSWTEMYHFNFTTTPPGTTPPRIDGTVNRVNPGRSGDYRLAVLVGVAVGRPNAQAAMDYLMSWPCVIGDITIDAGAVNSGCVASHGSQLGIANID